MDKLKRSMATAWNGRLSATTACSPASVSVAVSLPRPRPTRRLRRRRRGRGLRRVVDVLSEDKYKDFGADISG